MSFHHPNRPPPSVHTENAPSLFDADIPSPSQTEVFGARYSNEEKSPMVYNEAKNLEANSVSASFDESSHQAPVTKSELWGWYFFGWATEPFSAINVAVFYQLILQGLTQEVGYQLDHKTACDPQTIELHPCVVNIGGFWIDTSAFPLYITAISVFCQALLFISIGALADHGNLRKVFLLGFAILGAAVTILFLLVNAKTYLLGAIIVIVSNLAFGASFVFFYGYIPTLTRFHPEVLKAKESGDKEEYSRAFERIGNGISTHGMAIGYGAAVLLLIGCLGLVYGLGANAIYSLQVACAVVGIWWLLFLVVPLKYLKSRPGPPLPKGENFLLLSWKRVIKTIGSVRRLKQAFKFLAAWFLLSDAIATLVSVAVVYAKAELKVPQLQIMMAAVLVPFAAMLGNYVWLFVQRKLNMTTRQVVMTIAFMFSILPLYCLLGFFAPFGLKHIGEIWVVVLYHGMLLGAVQSYCRVLFSELLPKGHENEFFSLYSITDKGSAWIGPLMAAAIGTWTHNLRYSFCFLFVMLIVPVGIIWGIDVDKGKEEADAFIVEE